MTHTSRIFRLLATVLSLAPAFAFCAGDLAPAVVSGDIFAKKLPELGSYFSGERYNWVTPNKVMRFAKPAFTLGEMKVGETIFDIADGKITRVKMSVYNRGDEGRVTDEQFAALIDKTEKFAAALCGNAGKKYEYRPDSTSLAVEIAGREWETPHVKMLMEYSVTPRGTTYTPAADYLRLTIVPKTASFASSISMTQRQKNLRVQDNVTKEPDGARVIANIPMVDQGAKGYCAAATTARIMEYYGYEHLDQHQIAMWAKTDAQAGTNNEAMMDGIQRVLHDKYKLIAREIPPRLDFKELQKLVERYNSEAKREKRQQIVLPRAGVIYVDQIWLQFDPHLLKAARTRNKQQTQMWFARIKENIDKGVPVIWSVMLGVIKEPAIPQASGGHMRLIIGYGPGNNIIYSDSWGAGHERKTMDAEDALTITTGLKTITPRAN